MEEGVERRGRKALKGGKGDREHTVSFFHFRVSKRFEDDTVPINNVMTLLRGGQGNTLLVS